MSLQKNTSSVFTDQNYFCIRLTPITKCRLQHLSIFSHQKHRVAPTNHRRARTILVMRPYLTTYGTSSRDKLNEFLSRRDMSPIRSKLNKRWHCTNERTKRHYTRKARQSVYAVIEEIAPGDTDNLWNALVSSRGMVCQLPMDPQLHADSTLIEALTECYNNAGHCSTRRQILSILADKVSFKMLKRWILGLTLYRFNIARHHQLLHGRGAVLSTEHHTRMYVAPGQLSHFLNFITSGHIIQDLPFGEKKLKLSSNEELVIPNVIKLSLPRR